MKMKFIYALPVLLLTIFMVSFSNGPAGGEGLNGPRMQDRSGSPFAIVQGPTCAVCHNNGSFDPEISIELLDGGNSVVDYVANQTYTLRYTITAGAGSPLRYGMQSVILDNTNNKNAGNFNNPPMGTRVASIDDRKYFEHTMPNSLNTFQVEWVAPEIGTGEITVYAGGNATNDDGTLGGDNGTSNTLVLTELLTATSNPILLPMNIRFLPNPVTDVAAIEIQSDISGQFLLQLSDISGKSVFSESIHINTGENHFSKNLAALPSGIYLLKLTDGRRVRVGRLVKR